MPLCNQVAAGQLTLRDLLKQLEQIAASAKGPAAIPLKGAARLLRIAVAAQGTAGRR